MCMLTLYLDQKIVIFLKTRREQNHNKLSTKEKNYFKTEFIMLTFGEHLLLSEIYDP